jgi:hypothetical protein
MFNSDRRVPAAWGIVVCAFVVVAAILDYGCTHVLILGAPSTETGKLARLAAADRSTEIPIFGSSAAKVDFDPELLGLDCYNYGMSAASFDVVDVLLGIELSKPSSAPIIMEISNLGYKSFGDVCNFIPYARHPEVRHLLARYASMQWRFWIPGIRYFGYYDTYLKNYLAEHTTSIRKMDRGYTHRVLDAIPWIRSEFDVAVKKRLQEGVWFGLDPAQEQRLLYRLDGTPHRTFFLVCVPLHRSCFVHPRGLQERRRFIEKVATKKNVVVLDWSRVELPDEYYLDTVHLNERGAAEFSRRLGTEIRRIVAERGVKNDPNAVQPL